MVKSIPTTWNGVRFRSRLEARWAMFLEEQCLAWNYEPESYELPDGSWYVPDFWLPDLDCWLEVKGPGISGTDKTYALSLSTRHPAVVGQAPAAGFTDWFLMDAPEGRNWCDDYEWLTGVLGCPSHIAVMQRYRDARPFPAMPATLGGRPMKSSPECAT